MLQSPNTDFTFMKVVLHFYKTIFRLLKETDACSGESVKELFRMNPLLERCLKSLSFSKSAIESFLRVPENNLISHCYVNASWDVCPKYLVFLISNYWSDAENHVEVSLPSISTFLPEEMRLQISELVNGRYPDLRLLKAIVRYDYPFASRK